VKHCGAYQNLLFVSGWFPLSIRKSLDVSDVDCLEVLVKSMQTLRLHIRHPALVSGFPKNLEEGCGSATIMANYVLHGPLVGLIVQRDTELALETSGESAVVIRHMYSQ
jgi:hypothetical protein